MLSKNLRKVLLTFVIIVLIILALLIGFNIGYGFIIDQDAKAKVVESASLQAEIDKQLGVTTGSEGLIGETTGGDDEDYSLPQHVTQDTPGAIEIFINYGDGSEEIAEQLQEKGVIDNTLPFVIVSKINGYDGKYQRGTHFVLEGMNYNDIMYNLSLPAETTWVTFPEGFAYVDIKERLAGLGVNFDEEEMDRLVNTPSEFTQYQFIQDIPTDQEGRIYSLEGYLFPDTYQFDLNASEYEIINTLLRNTNNKLQTVYAERAGELGMSMDQVITLASLIQAESGHIQDQYKVSRVFHNRLNSDTWKLESDASINYLLKLAGDDPVWAVNESQMNIDSPYNTYMYQGLPPGPISNPGLEAIQAALYPDTEEANIWFFVATGQNGRSAFARTLAEHQANVELYRENWN